MYSALRAYGVARYKVLRELLYEHAGIYGLMGLGEEDAYSAVLWRLAQYIADICCHYEVESRVVALDELRNPLWDSTIRDSGGNNGT
jgi:hypothetical protein